MYVAFSLFNCTDLMESVILYVGILIVAYTQSYAAIISLTLIVQLPQSNSAHFVQLHSNFTITNRIFTIVDMIAAL